MLQAQDRVLKSFPEVERVFGKAGRADFDALAAVVAAQRLRTSASGTVSRFPASTAR